jgi:signal transduction histidine kinase
MNTCQKLFMAQVSHELRTPLTTILSSAELIQLSYHKWSDEKKLKYLGTIRKAALELTEVLNHKDFDTNLRDFAQENFK